MPLDPVVSQRLYQHVAERITRLIQSGELKPGERLPAEKELAMQLGVSRPTIREAMIAMEIAGLVEIRTGSGSYVRASQPTAPSLLDSGPGPLDLQRARVLIEGEIAVDAAMKATAKDLQEIEATIHEMQDIIASGGHSRVADRKFHVRIARASGNDVLANLVDNLWAGIFSPMFYKLSERTGLTEHQATSLSDHKAIFAALSTHDPVSARSAMRKHLIGVETILAGVELDLDGINEESNKGQNNVSV